MKIIPQTYYFIWFLILWSGFSIGQEQDSLMVNSTMTYNEFLAMVKKYHPRVKQANLKLSMAQAKLLKARGAFDPKIEIDFDNKKYKGKEYYNLLNGGLKIPTWFGVEVKAAFDRNEGIYVNPENNVPIDGLGSLGLTVPIGRDLWINERMAELRKAKYYREMGLAEKRMEAIEVIYDASVAYFEWVQAFEKYELYTEYWNNAYVRLQGVKQLVESGDKPAIDSIETGMVLKTRIYEREQMKLKLIKARLNLSNFLWTNDNIPLEADPRLMPEETLYQDLYAQLLDEGLINEQYNLKTNPKVRYYENKVKLLEVDKRFKSNQLWPKLNLGYYYLSEPSLINDQNFDNYKIGFNFSYSLFLRKERAAFQLAKYQLQDASYELSSQQLQLQNKLEYQNNEVQTLSEQMEVLSDLVDDFAYMLKAEEQLFQIGESSIFYINTREQKLVKAKIDLINLQYEYCKSNAGLVKLQANGN